MYCLILILTESTQVVYCDLHDPQSKQDFDVHEPQGKQKVLQYVKQCKIINNNKKKLIFCNYFNGYEVNVGMTKLKFLGELYD